ncbi:MAG: DUF4271 domain-containing protein [Bacteroidota bacterium]
MRYFILLCLLVMCFPVLHAQDRSNPFELTSRLPAAGARQPATSATTGQPYSPFDIRPAATSTASFPNLAPASAPNASRTPGPIVIQPTDPNKGQGSLLAINLILLLSLAIIWVLYGKFYRQCMRSTVNSSLMKQIFSRRSGGELGALWVGYLFFNIVLGFYLYLFAIRHDISFGLNIWLSWGVCTLFVAGLTGLKQWLLWIYARLFPVRKEVSYYAFMVMVFSILTGLFLVPVNLMVSYVDEAWKVPILYGAIAVLVIIYTFHLLRGGIVAKQYVFRRPVHIMLYICAIEVAPLLLIYRYLSDTLA